MVLICLVFKGILVGGFFKTIGVEMTPEWHFSTEISRPLFAVPFAPVDNNFFKDLAGFWTRLLAFSPLFAKVFSWRRYWTY
jgi:hypothetical protein